LDDRSVNTTTRPARQAPLGRFYDINERSLFLHRSGSGGPAVVFLPGASAIGLDYLNIHDRVSQFTTSVLYDRGGTGWSDPADLPRPLAEVAVELRELLRATDVPVPYVLVAHSLGCAYTRRFVQLLPEEVAGVVYLDGIVEDWETYMPQLRPNRPRERRRCGWRVCPGRPRSVAAGVLIVEYQRAVSWGIPRIAGTSRTRRPCRRAGAYWSKDAPAPSGAAVP
jgi:pimeloyl-ACP methyl ester carboxylesterase